MLEQGCHTAAPPTSKGVIFNALDTKIVALFYLHLNHCQYVQNKQKFTAKPFTNKGVQFFMYHKPF